MLDLAELSQLLTGAEFQLAVRHFGLTEDGNFVDHSDPQPLPNQNVLHVADPDLTEAERVILQSAKEKIFQARLKRVRPLRDDKVLASWNGMMLGAMARACDVLGDDSPIVPPPRKIWRSCVVVCGMRPQRAPCTTAGGKGRDSGSTSFRLCQPLRRDTGPVRGHAGARSSRVCHHFGGNPAHPVLR